MRNILFWVFWLGGVIITFGCSREGTGEAKPGASAKAANVQEIPVKLLLNWVPEPEFGGFYAAREDGIFRRHGLIVDIMGGGAGVPVVQMVAGGKVEFGIVGADDVITARVRGADVVPLFATFQTSPQAIMVHASRGVSNLGEVLKSGTLAVEPGLPYVSYLKKQYNFDGLKVVPYDGGVARFVADKDFAQQCFITAEPIAARRQGAEPKTFLIADEGFNPYAAVIITRSELWKNKPELVRSFVQASREGWRKYLDNPAPANAVMAKLNTGMDAQTFVASAEAQKNLIETPETNVKGLGSMTRERWETLGNQLVELGIIDKAPSVDEYWVKL